MMALVQKRLTGGPWEPCMAHDHVLIKIPGVPVSKLGPVLWVQTHTEQREV